MKKKYAVIMAAAMVMGSLAGCGGRAAESTAEMSAAESKSAENGTAQGGEEERRAPEGHEASEGAENGEGGELIVFAAASMTETMTEIAEMYREIRPDVEIVYTFDSSGTLKTQIEEGADCDIFISAAQKQMNQLDITADPEMNTDGLDFVDGDTRVNLVENRVVLAVPDGNPAGIEAFEDLAGDRLNLICLGNEDVPVGAYSEEILTNLGILDKLKDDSKITYGSNVKEVTTQVKEASVDCGIVYATDAFSAGLTVADEADRDQCRQVIYPAAVLKISKNKEEARAFLDYLTGEDCAAVFKSAGFSMAE